MVTRREINGFVKEFVSSYYQEVRHAREKGRKVAWCTGMAPSEFLQAMDFACVFPENHAAMAGARKFGLQLAEISEAEGYAQDLCSYARIDFGNIKSGNGPVGALPKPDLLLCCNNTCSTVTKWYENLAKYFGVPLVLIDTPFKHDREQKAGTVEYIVGQFEGLIETIQSVCGREFDYQRLNQVVENSDATSKIWSEILQMTKREPLAFTAFEAFNYMAPIVTMRGSNEALEFYETLAEKLERLEVTNAGRYKYRILWDGIPIWFKLRELSEWFRDREVALICSTYTHAWILPMNGKQPMQSMAKAYSEVLLNKNLDAKKEMLEHLVEEYELDGIIHHGNRSCKPAAFGLYQLSKELTDQKGISSIIVDGDQCDPRNFSMAQFETRIEAFLETI